MNATDYLMFNVVFIGNNISFVSSRFNMCNKLISISFAINIEPVRPSTSTDFLILAHFVFEFDTPALEHTLPNFQFESLFDNNVHNDCIMLY